MSRVGRVPTGLDRGATHHPHGRERTADAPMPKSAGIVPRKSTLMSPSRWRQQTKVDITNLPDVKQVTSHLAARLSRRDPRLCVPASRPVCLFQLRTKWDTRWREQVFVP